MVGAATATILNQLLLKAGEKAAETIGEKVAENAVKRSFWEKVTRLFVKEEEKKFIQQIESKPIATKDDVDKIKEKLLTEIKQNPVFASEIQTIFNNSIANKVYAEGLLKSIQHHTERYQELMEARPYTVGNPLLKDQYEFSIITTKQALEKDEKEFSKLVFDVR
ncbi:MAG: hypothetical protein ACK4ON_07880 [Bacteroidia bacterium]